MNVFDSIKGRRSIRKYLQKPVEFDKISVILQAGSFAPSSGNLQDYRFIVVSKKSLIQGIASECTEQYWIAQAPILIVVCADSETTERYYGLRGQRLYCIQNCAAAIQNILLTAHYLGLGACWVGSFNEDYVKDSLRIPEKVRPQAIITLGYPDELPDDKESQPLEHMVYFNEYGAKIENVSTLLKEYSKEVERILKEKEPELKEQSKRIKSKVHQAFHAVKESLKKLKK